MVWYGVLIWWPFSAFELQSTHTDAECRHLFPKKHLSQVKIKDLADVHAEFEDIKAMPPGAVKDALLKGNLNKQAIIIGTKPGEATVGQRLDILLLDPVTSRECMLDVTCVCSTCHSKIAAELAHTLARLRAQVKAAAGQVTQDPHETKISPAITKAANHKKTKYARLMALVQQLYDRGFKSTEAEFGAIVVTALGEIGPATVELQEFIMACFRRKLKREGERRDGFTPEQLSAKFRSDLRIGLQVAVAKGNAAMATAAGLPTANKRRDRLDPHRFARPRPASQPQGAARPSGRSFRPSPSQSARVNPRLFFGSIPEPPTTPCRPPCARGAIPPDAAMDRGSAGRSRGAKAGTW